jgi:hypothetical protein
MWSAMPTTGHFASSYEPRRFHLGTTHSWNFLPCQGTSNGLNLSSARCDVGWEEAWKRCILCAKLLNILLGVKQSKVTRNDSRKLNSLKRIPNPNASRC